VQDFYVTTAIPYVNAEPHLGHALEQVQADVLARHRRLRGQHVRFQTGTDDNALKNITAARAAGVDVRSFVSANADRFSGLRSVLELSFDDFVRTSSDPRHLAGVERLWRASAARGDFYRKSYAGLYCVGCEAFVTSPVCDEHGDTPELVSEENWFFRLSAYTDQLLDALTSTIRISPLSRRNEVLSFVRAGLADISVSRPAARSSGWGIPVPDDSSQVIYVWWDALANYVTSLDNGSPWWHSAERVHVIGKGILRFHAVYWPALLLSAGLPLPDTIFVHDYLTVNGSKISKSCGNSVRPADLAARYGVDAVRWWLLRGPARVGDADFTEEKLIAQFDTELANGVGNLFNRVRGLAGALPAGPPIDLASKVDDALRDFDFRAATGAIVTAVDDANRLIEAAKPWQLNGSARTEILSTLGGACRTIAHELIPFIPSGAARALETAHAFPRLGGEGNRHRGVV
jgi:methionyl-tRNA synthetase